MSYSLFVSRDLLHLLEGSFASKYAQLFVSFFIGGMLHSFASLLVCGNDDGKFSFFIIQFVAIFIEDHVIDFAKCIEAKENRAWRVLGYLWAFCRLSFLVK
ncbi:hypothetical protein V2W45_1241162 [Cenococcum geophilum]